MLRLWTFGTLSLDREGRLIAGPAAQRRRLALLALLARPSGARGLSREKIAAYLWPESDETRSRNSLKQAISVLRRELTPELFLSGTPDLRLNPEVIVSDVADFESALEAGMLEAAVRLYRGPFLDGFHLGDDSEEFERWSDAERARLAERAALALESLAAAAARAGDHPGAVQHWRRLAASEPLSTRYVVGLVRALSAAGDGSSAVRLAREHAALVEREMGSPPDPALRRALAELKPAEAVPTPAQAVLPTPPAPAPPVSQDPALPRQTAVRSRRRPGLYMLGSLAIAGALVVATVPGFDARHSSGGRRIAVRPFENLGDPTDSTFTLGLTDELTAQLAMNRGLEVISASSARQYARADRSVRLIGRELGVDYVLEGGVVWQKRPGETDRVRITPKLVRVADDRHVWADVLESDATGLFELQDRITQHVAEALDASVAVGPDVARTRMSANLDAYAYYLRGKGYLDRSYTDSLTLGIAADLFARAVRLDRGFALAWARLSEVHSLLYWRGLGRRTEQASLAKAAADSALRLQPDLPESRRALAYYHGRVERDFTRSYEEFGRAFATRPNDVELLVPMGTIERRLGRYRDGARHLSRAVALDPRSANTALMAGLTYAFVRDYAEAARYLDRAIILQPDWAMLHAARAQLQLAWKGDTVGARRIIRAAALRIPVAQFLGYMGYNADVAFSAFLITGDSTFRSDLAGLEPEDFRDFPYSPALYLLLRAYEARNLGRLPLARAYSDSARVALETMTGLDPTDEVPWLLLAFARAGTGDVDGALEASARSVELYPFELDRAAGAERGVLLAQLYLLLGKPERSLTELERLIREPSPLSVEELRVDPTWAPLRSHPRFQRLIDGAADDSGDAPLLRADASP